MGSKLNRGKSKIYGIGNWKTRDQWPVNEFKIEQEYLYTLGIYHSNNYENCVDRNWNEVVDKMKKHCNMLHSRKLTLHQRVIYANACILSKMWYTSHIYPLTDKYSKEANTTLFNYIWGGRYEPIKRATLYRPKDEGGLAIVNCLNKAKTIMVSSFIKSYVHEHYRNSIMLHYCFMRLNNILPSEYSLHDASPITTPYYEKAIRSTQNILHLPRFPYISNKELYMSMSSREESYSELQYPLFNWKRI